MAIATNRACASAPVDELAEVVRASRTVTDTVRNRIGRFVGDSRADDAAAAIARTGVDGAGPARHLLEGESDGGLDVRESVADIPANQRRIEAALEAFDME